MPEFERIRYEAPAAGVARLVISRPERQNAQDRKMLYEVDAALCRAMKDDSIKVVIIAADGPNFSGGHDIREQWSDGDYEPVTQWTGGFQEPGQAGHMALEEEIYLGLCWRWRNLPKPTIVQVQGICIAGGLMLVWPFDLVIASEDALFSDPVVAAGVNGHEFFTHAWELGARKAKEMLFTGGQFTAEECHRLGMVNHVVKREELSDFTLALAKRVAVRPAMGLRLAKLAVNQSLDAQGQWTAVQAAFSLHHLGHAHARILHGSPVEPSSLEEIRREAKDGKGREPT